MKYMKTNIEEYLKNNRDRIDVDQPEEDIIWEGIRSSISNKKIQSRFQFWKVAAIFLTIFTLSYILYNELGRKEEVTITLAQINELLGERESQYQQKVLGRMNTANIHQHTEHQIIIDLIAELDELDVIYDEAMNDLTQHGYLEQIVEIIFDTYEKRIQILEKIIRESQKIEAYENHEERISL